MQKRIKKGLYIIIVILVLCWVIALGYIYLVLQPDIYKRIATMPSFVQQQVHLRQGTYVQLSQVSPFVANGAIASQDERFYTNSGIDIRGTLRAMLMSIITGRRQGASTITEQLAKNAYFNDTDNLITDIQTKIYALFITIKFTKQQILTMYLNDIYFGKTAYGISSASLVYFQTSPEKLSIAQSVFLIGLINAPSYFADHLPQARKEGTLVLIQMKQNNFISSKQEQAAEATLDTLVLR